MKYRFKDLGLRLLKRVRPIHYENIQLQSRFAAQISACVGNRDYEELTKVATTIMSSDQNKGRFNATLLEAIDLLADNPNYTEQVYAFYRYVAEHSAKHSVNYERAVSGMIESSDMYETPRDRLTRLLEALDYVIPGSAQESRITKLYFKNVDRLEDIQDRISFCFVTATRYPHYKHLSDLADREFVKHVHSQPEPLARTRAYIQGMLYSIPGSQYHYDCVEGALKHAHLLEASPEKTQIYMYVAERALTPEQEGFATQKFLSNLHLIDEKSQLELLKLVVENVSPMKLIYRSAIIDLKRFQKNTPEQSDAFFGAQRSNGTLQQSVNNAANL